MSTTVRKLPSNPVILVTGANGQVGFELARSLAPLGQVEAVDRRACDLSDAAAIARMLDRMRPDLIVNAGAYTAVDKAEADADTAFAVNARAPQLLAAAAASMGVRMIHYSTDYVFDGEKTGWYTEDDVPAPRSVYGRSKLEGEQAVAASGCDYWIFRTSWVFGLHGGNFAKTMLRLASERDTLRVVADQFGAPTPAWLIADVTAQAISRGWSAAAGKQVGSGVFHLCASGETSWHGYASLLLARAAERGARLRVQASAVEPIPASTYPVAAARPANSRLDTGKLREQFGLTMPDWRVGVQRLVDQIYS
ncbi:dTDP-4-dehydrorhamnose reductase [Cupriavidus numazuensis]|uniref:dTDP-4-dehydrorhamnose reductase n=1 Tax=Cupriavidus numazuensis TaxID=221992 RepID=A0ABN7Q9C9_9BURK|nr:dTDP-4-dehydrorhamnose reductase [Cupriavidus numazuensis]CAG2158763.1 dTDP-4-dehydrorhamnose reductase [Cupriavidus numazuensis]